MPARDKTPRWILQPAEADQYKTHWGMLRFLLSIVHQKHLGSDFYPLVCHHRVT